MNELTIIDRVLFDGRVVVEVTGEVDLYSSPPLREHLADLVADGSHHLVLDLRPVTFLDSTGLGVLVGALKTINARHGSLQLIITAPHILRIFAITGLSRVFSIITDPPTSDAAAP